MKIDLTQTITEFNGKPVEYREDPTDAASPKRDMTLKDVIVDALKAGDRQQQDPAENVKLFRLGKKIWAAQSDVEITAAEVVTIQKLICSYWGSPVVKGQACDMLDEAKSEPKLAAVGESK